MLEQIKDLCLFMICGQTLLYFQSGKKYEKICRMILELLILAGLVGMILDFLQSIGFRKGEMEAAGGAVAGMQRSMEEALSKQLDMTEKENIFPVKDELEDLIEKHTSEEIKSAYNYFAERYGFEIQEVKKQGDKLQVFVKKIENTETMYKEREEDSEQNPENSKNNVEIENIEINEIALTETGENDTHREDGEGEEKEHLGKSQTSKEAPETFRRQFALVLAMEEENLEVILID